MWEDLEVFMSSISYCWVENNCKDLNNIRDICLKTLKYSFLLIKIINIRYTGILNGDCLIRKSCPLTIFVLAFKTLIFKTTHISFIHN